MEVEKAHDAEVEETPRKLDLLRSKNELDMSKVICIDDTMIYNLDLDTFIEC